MPGYISIGKLIKPTENKQQCIYFNLNIRTVSVTGYPITIFIIKKTTSYLITFVVFGGKF